jgi:nitrogen regulatory protein P-II 1
VRKIEAVIQRHKVEAVREALREAGITRLTVMEVRDFGKSKEHKEIYRSNEYDVDSLVRLKIETLVPQRLVPKAVSIIAKKGEAGRTDSDQIIISSVNEVGLMYSHEIKGSV